MRIHPSTPVLTALILLAFAVPARSAVPATPDQGSFVVYSYNRPVGREDWKLSVRNDSLVLESSAELTLDSQPVRKKYMRSSYRRADWRLLGFNSSLDVEKRVYRAAVAPGPDTTVTVYHETPEGGEGNTYYRPPGRLYVLDALFYSLFQVIASTLASEEVESTPITILAVGARDTVDQAIVRRTGTESIRWGERPVTASRMQFQQGPLVFDLWLDPAGRVLRIAHAASGLLVERKPPAVKRPAKPRPKPKPAG